MKVYLIFILGIYSCSNNAVNTDVFPKHFKVEFKHDKYGSKVVLPVSFGDDKNKYLLQFDNHSPSWVNPELIKDVSSIRKSKNTYYKTSVADGRELEGDVYVCYIVSIGGIKFNDVLFYAINDTGASVKGVIGENIISHGVWVIDILLSSLFLRMESKRSLRLILDSMAQLFCR